MIILTFQFFMVYQGVSFVGVVPVEKSKTVGEMRAKMVKSGTNSKAEMLMARLVDKPENSHVLRMANSYTRREKPMPPVTNGKNLSNNSLPTEENVRLLNLPNLLILFIFVLITIDVH